ncbi:restriction endonuclease subunit S [Bradyrhizobium diazoefficiens]
MRDFKDWPYLRTFAKKIGSGITPRGGETAYRSSGVPFIRSQNVRSGKLVLDGVAFIDEKQHLSMSNSWVQPLDVLLNITGASIGRSCVVPKNVAVANVNQHVCIIRLNGELDPHYVSCFLNSPYGQKQVWSFQSGGSREGLNYAQVGAFRLPKPNLREQVRIAEVLYAWEEATDQVGRLIQAKKRFIRGILAGSVSDAREVAKTDGWEKTTIGEVATLVQQRVNWDEDANYRLITVKRGCGGLVFRGDRKGHEILTKDMYTVRAGDFLISKRQVVHGAWAMVPPEFDGAHVSKEYACLRAKPGKLWMPYFDWLSRTERLQHEAFICSYGVDIEKMVLNVDWLLQTPLLLPRSIETQKSMAAGLDCLQREVELLQAQMEALSRQKRGLMQKLLTGEWRVPVHNGEVDAVTSRVTEEAAQ